MNNTFTCFYGNNTKALIELPTNSTVQKLKEVLKNRYNFTCDDKAIFIDGILIENDTSELDGYRKGYDEILIADQSTVREQTFYFADNSKYDTIKMSDLLSIRLIENTIASKIGFSMDQLVFDITFDRITTNNDLEAFRTFNFKEDYVIPLSSKSYRQRNPHFRYPIEIRQTKNPSPVEKESRQMTVTFRNNRNSRRGDRKQVPFLSLPMNLNKEEVGFEQTPSESSNMNEHPNEVSKTYTADADYDLSSVFSKSTLELLRKELDQNKKRSNSISLNSSDFSETNLNDPNANLFHYNIPPHKSVSIQGIKDHLILSGKLEFNEKDINDFIYKMSTYTDNLEELYVQNEQYFNFNEFKYAKLLKEMNGIDCWFHYMIMNNKNFFHLENNIFILFHILDNQESLCSSMINSSYIKSIVSLFDATISNESKSIIISILIRIIDTDPITVSGIICKEIEYQEIILRLRDVPMSDLHNLNKHLESVQIKDHSILFTAFYADMTLCKTNVKFLTEIYTTILTDFKNIPFSEQEIASFNNLILNTDESFDKDDEFKLVKNQLFLHLNQRPVCCTIL